MILHYLINNKQKQQQRKKSIGESALNTDIFSSSVEFLYMLLSSSRNGVFCIILGLVHCYCFYLLQFCLGREEEILCEKATHVPPQHCSNGSPNRNDSEFCCIHCYTIKTEQLFFNPTTLVFLVTETQILVQTILHNKGSRPEWCISTTYHALDTAFWSGTLNNQYKCTRRRK